MKKIEHQEFFHCPCGGELIDRTALGDDLKSKFCLKCGYIFYFRLQYPSERLRKVLRK